MPVPLHVTNGDSARGPIQRLGLGGTIIAWRDALHEGPVPAGLDPDELSAVRARSMSESGWAGYDEALRSLSERDHALASAAQRSDESVGDGSREPHAVFEASQAREDPRFLGDAIAFDRLAELGRGPEPLVSGPPHALTAAGAAVSPARRTGSSSAVSTAGSAASASRPGRSGAGTPPSNGFAPRRVRRTRARSSPPVRGAPAVRLRGVAAAAPAGNGLHGHARTREVEADDRQRARPIWLVDEDSAEIRLRILGRGVEVVDATREVVVEAKEDHSLDIVERRQFV